MEKNELKPALVFEQFAKINEIPRPSKHEENMIEFLKEFGKSHKSQPQVEAKSESKAPAELKIAYVEVDSIMTQYTFAGVTARGSEQNDVFVPKAKNMGATDDAANHQETTINQDVAARITTKSNHSGGIQGGLSNGQDIYFRVAFKPVATLLMEQDTVDLEGNPTKLTARGRHDPCVLPNVVRVKRLPNVFLIAKFFS